MLVQVRQTLKDKSQCKRENAGNNIKCRCMQILTHTHTHTLRKTLFFHVHKFSMKTQQQTCLEKGDKKSAGISSPYTPFHSLFLVPFPFRAFFFHIHVYCHHSLDCITIVYTQNDVHTLPESLSAHDSNVNVHMVPRYKQTSYCYYIVWYANSLDVQSNLDYLNIDYPYPRLSEYAQVQ